MEEYPVLTKDFFSRSAPIVAEDLIGKFLVRKIKGKTIASMITETEGYEGHDDLASHASKGKTARTEVMFGEPGVFYIYLIYGMYSMLNVVTGEKDHPSAVLIRGTESVSGPGRLTKHLDIGKKFNTLPAEVQTGLWFEDRGFEVEKGKIISGPRIGVEYAGPVWSIKPWRFLYKLEQVKKG